MKHIILLILFIFIKCEYEQIKSEKNNISSDETKHCCIYAVPPINDTDEDSVEIPETYSCQSSTYDGYVCYEYVDVYLSDVESVKSECDNFGDPTKVYTFNKSYCQFQSNELFGYCTYDDWGNYIVQGYKYQSGLWTEQIWKDTCETQEYIWNNL